MERGLAGPLRGTLAALPGGAPGALEELALELLLRAPVAEPLALAATLRTHLGTLARAAGARGGEFGPGHVCRRLLLWLRLQPAALVPVLEACRAQMGPFDGLEDKGVALEAVMAARFAADSAAAAEFRRLWDWTPLHRLLAHRVPDVRWHAAQLLAWVLEMGPEDARILVAKAVSEHEAIMSASRWAKVCDSLSRELSAAMRSCIAGDSAKELKEEETVAMCDQLLRGPVIGPEKRSNGAETFVFTPSICRAARLTSISVAAGHPVLLCGPAGCGKSTLVQHLGARSGKSLAAVHMDDSSDMRFLLGSYVCGEQPGSFEWRDGPLTHAVRTGQWLLLEDIDAAPVDVLSTVGAVAASGRLNLPSQGGEICAAPGFRVAATLSTPQEPSQSTFLTKMQESARAVWTVVLMPEPTTEEIVTLVGVKFPDIQPLLPLALHMLNSIRELSIRDLNGEAGGRRAEEDVEMGQADTVLRPAARLVVRSRPVTLRDLHKWCVRMTTLRGSAWSGQAVKGRKIDSPGDVCKLPENFRRACFQESFDLFAAPINNESDKELLLLHLARLWGLPDDNVHYFQHLHSPSVNFSRGSSECEIGRSVLQKHHMAAYEEQQHLDTCSEYTLTGSATRLLERVAVAVQVSEPVLLVGETGVGKTSAVQALSKDLGAPLRVVNLSHQSDSADLLGGFKPVEPKSRVHDLIKKVTPLVHSTWPQGDNTKFVKSLLRYCHEKKYRKVLKAVKSANSRIEKSLEYLQFSCKGAAVSQDMEGRPSLGRHVHELLPGWAQVMSETEALELLLSSDSTFCFAYVPGALAEAITEGHWVLLDEINLAPHETLQRLSGLLDSPEGSVTLTERGDLQPLRRHPQFRIFAAMNPATDAGKSDLPTGLRGRFTEIYVSDELPRDDLERIVSSSLAEVAPDPPVSGIVDFYVEVRRLAVSDLEDGAGQRPCYSLRSLTRLLRYARKTAPTYGLRRSLLDGALVSFATQLCADSRKVVTRLAEKIMPGQKFARAIAPSLTGSRAAVEFEGFWIDAGTYEDPRKGLEGKFVMTPTVRTRLQDVARAVSFGSSPILLQGPTSAGKTSLVSHLASKAGYRCIRINNHEHTDIQEYMGSYTSAEDGRICFKEGLLVQALRKGYWIVLDELNLAPTEVLEALNRLLDDNQELYVPELNEIVRPAPGFMLFATQNPPGPYSGRKALSRALRNRFIEMQVDDLPPEEVASMLEVRCDIPKSYATKMVQVMKDLQRARSASAVFVGKGGLVTPRDLFRWASRGGSGYQHLAEDGFLLLGERLRTAGERDTVLKILERIMKIRLIMPSVYDDVSAEAQEKIKDLAKILDAENVVALNSIVWGPTMRYLYTVTARSVLHQEPVLLIGETGCGKTTVCQTIAEIRQQKLHIINCHQHSEASDFLGGFRPSRQRNKGKQMAFSAATALLGTATFCSMASAPLVEQLQKFARAAGEAAPETDVKELLQAVKMLSKELPQLYFDEVGSHGEQMDTDEENFQEIKLQIQNLKKGSQLFTSPFEWSDGPLVQAMQNGDAVLIDEINLAADAVIERLNSVLEPERTLTLSERGGSENFEIVAHPEFRIFATMNPGLDFGKRELSPALRSRFTECWIPSALEDSEELLALVQGRLDPSIPANEKVLIGDTVLSFWLAFRKAVASTIGDTSLSSSGFSFSVRDILSWIHFINDSLSRKLFSAKEAIAHGAFLTIIDTIGVGSSSEKVLQLRGKCISDLASILHWSAPQLEAVAECGSECPRYEGDNSWGIPPFMLTLKSSHEDSKGGEGFQMEAPTVRKNVLRILRALHLRRAIMLEGSPGVGKSSIVAALAQRANKALVRINFSEQTDMADLVGNDLPSEAGGFAWSDGPLLSAIKEGSWVLLDELNLASQSVLEGLNSLLDHREEIFIPELGQKFPCAPGFQVFAAQNPLSQGGGRKGLPRSFMNRFTRVQVEPLSVEDLRNIMLHVVSPDDVPVPGDLLHGMVAFVSELRVEAGPFGGLARKGAPWDFNLRDLLRWYSVIQEGLTLSVQPVTTSWCRAAVSHAYNLVFRQRMRTETDKESLDDLFVRFFRFKPCQAEAWLPASGRRRIHGIVQGDSYNNLGQSAWQQGHHVAREHLSSLEAALYSTKEGWPTLLVGPSAALRESLVEATAAACDAPRVLKISCGPNTDASDLLGGFEQEAQARRRAAAAQQLHTAARDCAKMFLLRGISYTEASQAWEVARRACERAETLQAIQIDQGLKQDQLLEALTRVRAALGVGGRDEAAEAAIAGAEVVLYDEKETTIRWQDGPLLKALREGRWLVLDNANLCSPSVLDRLNPLLEPGGRLLVNEAGGGENQQSDAQHLIISPHKNFRIFLSYDPSLGEISRAMRNRCLEIHLVSPCLHSSDMNALCVSHGLDTQTPAELAMVASSLSCHRSDSYEGSRRMCAAFAASFDVLLSAGLSHGLASALAFEYAEAASDAHEKPGDHALPLYELRSGGQCDTFAPRAEGPARNLSRLLHGEAEDATSSEIISLACAVVASGEMGATPLECLYCVNNMVNFAVKGTSDEVIVKLSLDSFLGGELDRGNLHENHIALVILALTQDLFIRVNQTASAAWVKFIEACSVFLKSPSVAHCSRNIDHIVALENVFLLMQALLQSFSSSGMEEEVRFHVFRLLKSLEDLVHHRNLPHHALQDIAAAAFSVSGVLIGDGARNEGTSRFRTNSKPYQSMATLRAGVATGEIRRAMSCGGADFPSQAAVACTVDLNKTLCGMEHLLVTLQNGTEFSRRGVRGTTELLNLLLILLQRILAKRLPGTETCVLSAPAESDPWSALKFSRRSSSGACILTQFSEHTSLPVQTALGLTNKVAGVMDYDLLCHVAWQAHTTWSCASTHMDSNSSLYMAAFQVLTSSYSSGGCGSQMLRLSHGERQGSSSLILSSAAHELYSSILSQREQLDKEEGLKGIFVLSGTFCSATVLDRTVIIARQKCIADCIVSRLPPFFSRRRSPDEERILMLAAEFSRLVGAFIETLSEKARLDARALLDLLLHRASNFEFLSPPHCDCEIVSRGKAALSSSTDATFANVLHEVIYPCINFFFMDKRAMPAMRACTGRIFVYIGLLRLHLGAPRSQYDPAMTGVYEAAGRDQKKRHIAMPQVYYIQKLIAIVGRPSIFSQSLLSNLEQYISRNQDLREDTEGLSEPPLRPQPSQYLEIYETIQSALNDLFEVSKLCRLLQSLSAGTGPEVWEEAIHLRDTVNSWTSSLRRRFWMYRDIVDAIVLGGLEIIHGLHCIVRYRAGKDSYVRRTSKLLTASPYCFPDTSGKPCDWSASIRALRSLNAELLQKRSGPGGEGLAQGAAEFAVAAIERTSAASKVSSWMMPEQIEDVKGAFYFLVSKWEALKAKEEEDAREADRAYSTKVYNSNESIISEDELDSWFVAPDLEEGPVAGMEIEDDKKKARPGHTQELVPSSSKMEELFCRRIAALHECVFGTFSQGGATGSESSYADYAPLWHSLGRGMALASQLTPGSSERAESLIGYALGCRHEAVLLEGHQKKSASKVDVRKPAVGQICMLLDPMKKLHSKVVAKLEELDGHPLLSRLLESCEHVLRMGVLVPLRKAIAALDLLLDRAKVWQDSALGVSGFHEELRELQRIADSWRRLEITAWENALEFTAEAHVFQALKGWFHIYSILQFKPGSVPSQNDLIQVARCVEEFLTSSTVGQYATRLKLVRSFLFQVQAEQVQERSQMKKKSLKRLAAMLFNLHVHYNALAEKVRESEKSERSTLEKELRLIAAKARREKPESLTGLGDAQVERLGGALHVARGQLRSVIRRYDVALSTPASVPLKDGLVPSYSSKRVEDVDSTFARDLDVPGTGDTDREDETSTEAHSLIGTISTAPLSELCGNRSTVLASQGLQCTANRLNTILEKTFNDASALKELDLFGAAEAVDEALRTLLEEVDLEPQKKEEGEEDGAADEEDDKEREAEERAAKRSQILQKRRGQFADVLRMLRRFGLPRRLMGEKLTDAWLFSPLPTEADDFFRRQAPLSAMSQWSYVNASFHTATALAQHLPSMARQPHEDLIPRDTEAGAAAVNHLQTLQRSQRRVFEAGCTQNSILQDLESTLSDLLEACCTGERPEWQSLPHQAAARRWLWAVKDALDRALDSVLQFQAFLSTAPVGDGASVGRLSTAAAVGTSLEHLRSFDAALRGVLLPHKDSGGSFSPTRPKRALAFIFPDGEGVRDMCPAVVTWETLLSMRTALERVGAARGALLAMMGSCRRDADAAAPALRAFQALRVLAGEAVANLSLKSPGASRGSSVEERAAQHVCASVEGVLMWAQESRAPALVDDVSRAHAAPLNEATERLATMLAVDRCTTVCKSVGALVGALVQAFESGMPQPHLVTAAKSALGFLSLMCSAHRHRLYHAAQFHRRVCHFTQITAAYMSSLCTGGFRVPPAEKGEDVWNVGDGGNMHGSGAQLDGDVRDAPQPDEKEENDPQDLQDLPMDDLPPDEAPPEAAPGGIQTEQDLDGPAEDLPQDLGEFDLGDGIPEGDDERDAPPPPEGGEEQNGPDDRDEGREDGEEDKLDEELWGLDGEEAPGQVDHDPRLPQARGAEPPPLKAGRAKNRMTQRHQKTTRQKRSLTRRRVQTGRERRTAMQGPAWRELTTVRPQTLPRWTARAPRQRTRGKQGQRMQGSWRQRRRATEGWTSKLPRQKKQFCTLLRSRSRLMKTMAVLGRRGALSSRLRTCQITCKLMTTRSKPGTLLARTTVAVPHPTPRGAKWR